MKYFLHDTNAFQDEKITELFMAHGYEGLGLFFSILEKLAQQEKPVKTAVLKQQLSVGKKLEKCWLFLESLQLISSNNGETFNDNLLKFSEKYQVSKEKNRERVAQWREKQALTESVMHYESVRNAPKVKESKEKESKENIIAIEGGTDAANAALSLQNTTLAERLEKAKEVHRQQAADMEALKAQLATKQTRVARTAKKHAFADSPYADAQAVATALAGTDYEHADAAYYHEAIRNWAEGKGELKVDWLATIRNAMLRDSKEGKLKLNPNSTHTPYVDPQRNAAIIREREQRLGLVDTAGIARGYAISRAISASVAASAAGAQGVVNDRRQCPPN